MLHECHLHRERTALWRCPECATAYCSECIPGGEDNFSGGEPRCPLCSKSLNHEGGGVEGEPFWRLGPDLLRYGLKTGPLGVAVFAALLIMIGTGVGASVFFAWFGLLLVVFASLALVSYGLGVTVRMAQGEWQPPPFEQAYHENRNLAFKQIALMLVLFAVPLLAGMNSPVLAGLLFFLALLVLPAAIMILALSESLVSAINPLMQSRVISSVGWPWLLFWFALSAVTAAPDLLIRALGDNLTGLTLVFVISVFSCYALLVAYALMGYLLYQYAGELGLAGRQRRGRSLPAEQYQRKAALGLSRIYAHHGRLKDALDVVDRTLNGRSGDMGLHEQKHRLLKSLRNTKQLSAHGREYCRVLVAVGNPGNATSVLKDIWQADPDFRLDDPAAALAIARVFHQQQQFRDARRLLADLHRNYPDFEHLDEACLLLAQVYLEGFDSPDHARRILGFLQKNRPDALDTEQARYLRRMIAGSA